MYFHFIKHRRIFYIISGALSALSILAILMFGLNWGIDFVGGAELQVQYKNQPPSFEEIQKKLGEIGMEDASLQKSGEAGIILKLKAIDEAQRQQIMDSLKSLGEIEEGSESFQSIGPLIGKELRQKTNVVTILALLSILIYIAISFRKMKRPVKSYVYGATGVIALFHDVLVPIGVLAILGKFYGVEITIPIIAAFLTVFGYSINDTVVVFDRIRENLLKGIFADFAETVDQSLNQTFARSINTVATVLIVLFALLVFGGPGLRYFSLVLFIGVGLGMYSSIFLASPMVYSYTLIKEKKQGKKRGK